MPSIIPAGSFLSLFNPTHWKMDAKAGCYSGDDSDYDSSDSDDGNDSASKKEAEFATGPFCWPTWQARTGFMAPVFSPHVYEGTPEAWRSEDRNAAVWSFATTFWALPQIKKVTFLVRSTRDNTSAGRGLYLDWIKGEYPKWSVNQVILASLCENGVDPYTTMKARKVPKVRNADVSFYLRLD